MNNTYDDFDTQIQPEEIYEQQNAAFLVMLWLTTQSMWVEVWKN